MITISFAAPTVKKVLVSCHDLGHDKLWLVRGTSAVYLTTPDRDVAALPEYLGPGFVSLLGTGLQPNVDPISIFHKTLKMLHDMPAFRAKQTWVVLQFTERDFRVCLMVRDGRKKFSPGE